MQTFPFLLLFIFILNIKTSLAQDRCGTVEYTRKLKNQNLLKENETVFENWLRNTKSKSKKTSPFRTHATYQVPVVVHVIHNGEAVGIGTNISNAQILSQLAVLNKDYKRLNTDAFKTPTEFLPVAGIFDIEFVLAKRNPEGLPTTGIVRAQGPKLSFTINDSYELKSTSYWPAEEYLNLWVCNNTDYLGYSQFPVSPLAGLANSSNNRLTDGVVIAYQAFGSSDDGAFDLEPNYNKGRTATHEIGHFFGLRHIWGDDSGTCDGTDYVDDTPNQTNNTSGCPAHPSVSCSNNKMFQNYLDYTNDVCMNLFTQGQVSRMKTVIENSPRRVSLLTSPALFDPVPVANDLGIKEIITPSASECNSTFTPTIEIKNYGSNSITSTQIQIKKDGVVVETKLFPSLSLAQLQSIVVTFNNIIFLSGAHTVTFTILQTNGTADGNPADNVVNQSTQIAFTQSLPFTEAFSGIPAAWTIQNPDQKLTWQNVNAPNASPSNNAMKMDFFNYEDSEGEIDLLISPVLDLSTTTLALLTFDISYAQFNSSRNDGLRIVVIENCSSDINQATEIYTKKGFALSTTNNTTNDFVPTSASQWRNEFINLNTFIGKPNIQLAFIGLNDYGNNLYLDNIGITTTAYLDIELTEIISPSPVICESMTTPNIRVKNTGTITITSFSIVTKVNNANPVTTIISGINIPPNETRDVFASNVGLPNEDNILKITLSSVNGVADINPDNDTKQVKILINDNAEQIPQSQNFNTDFSNQWIITNPSGGMDFQSVSTNYATSLYFNAFDDSEIGNKAWLISPVYDFSTLGVSVREMYFDLSYKSKPGTNDRLQILASIDCGQSYPITLFDRSGDLLSSNETSSTSWKPNQPSDWETISVDLSAVAKEKYVRIAFVFTNDSGNNLYLDNINYFVLTKLFTVYPNPTSKNSINITLNLPEKETAKIDIIDRIGKILFSEAIDEAQDQNFSISIPDAAAGLYFVRVRTKSKMHSEKLLLID